MSLTSSKTDRDFNKYRDAGGNNTKVAVSIEQDISNPIPVAGVTISFKTIIDEISSDLSYVGDALPGTLLSAASWRIRKIETISGVTTVSYADGDSSLDNIWDNRLSLTYS